MFEEKRTRKKSKKKKIEVLNKPIYRANAYLFISIFKRIVFLLLFHPHDAQTHTQEKIV